MDRRDFIEKSALAAGGALLSATGVEALANNKNKKTMKVLMINGSPHQKGNTAIALNEIAKQLKENGIDSEIVWIGNQAVPTPTRPCTSSRTSFLPPPSVWT